MSERLRAFVGRQMELRERLRWTPPRSARRRRLEAELRQLVRDELAAETGAPAGIGDDATPPVVPPDPYGGRAPYWTEN